MKHAKLSASGSARWLNCPGSVQAEEKYPPQGSSPYALEGTRAHEVADRCLTQDLQAESFVGTEVLGAMITLDQAEPIQQYVDYCRGLVQDSSCEVFTEERVDFSNAVPGGFGTNDYAVISPKSKRLDIADLKFGKGVKVFAEGNSQAMLYAIGFINEYGWMYDIDTVHIHIIQPRLYHFDEWKISRKDVDSFARFAYERATLALSGTGPRIPGEAQCQWCLDKHDCPALMDFTQKAISAQFDDLDHLDQDSLSDSQRARVIEAKPLVMTFLKAVEQYAFKRLLDGHEFPDHKLVEGRSNRQWIPDAEDVLASELGEAAYTKKLIGVGEAERQLGKTKVNDLTHKPEGKPTMAHMSDRRRPLSDVDFGEEHD